MTAVQLVSNNEKFGIIQPLLNLKPSDKILKFLLLDGRPIIKNTPKPGICTYVVPHKKCLYAQSAVLGYCFKLTTDAVK